MYREEDVRQFSRPRSVTPFEPREKIFVDTTVPCIACVSFCSAQVQVVEIAHTREPEGKQVFFAD